MRASRIRPRLTYANVVTTLALFAVVAGGTALALPGKHRVRADDLRKNAVRAPAIATGAIGSSEIKDGSVGGIEIGDGQISSPDVADQSLGYQDLGSNSVIARIRSTGPIASGDGGSANPVTVPLSGSDWAQAGDEVDIIFGQVTYTRPAVCGGSPTLQVQLLVDGVLLDADGFGNTAPGTTKTESAFVARPWLFEPGVSTPHTAAVRIFDTCSGGGEDFTLNDIGVDVVGTR
jgi:hypothetical protein